MRKTLVYGLAVLLSGTVQAAATDDYLNGLKALDAGRQSEGLYLALAAFGRASGLGAGGQ